MGRRERARRAAFLAGQRREARSTCASWSWRTSPGSRTSSSGRLRAAGIEVDLVRRTVIRAGDVVHLSATELDLLVELMRHCGRARSREQLLREVWGYDHDPGTNVVDVYIGYLRRKLALPGRATPIETVRGVGYRLRERG
jgi:DNA-binding response OmpR family regulator